MSDVATVDDWLDKVDYYYINYQYRPSEFSLGFVQFIRDIANDGKGDSHPTPPVHLQMLDNLCNKDSYLVNLCARGFSKTTLFGEYLLLYLAVFGSLPGFGEVWGVIYVADSMQNGAKSLRKNLENRYNSSKNIRKFVPTAKFTDEYIEFINIDGKPMTIVLKGSKSGVRGVKMYGRRPELAIIDDVITDEDAKSPIEMGKIRDTIYSKVMPALDPTRRKVVLNGTPFNKDDIMTQAVESGAWTVNVYPICQEFPCSREAFVGAWESRFNYDFVKQQYDFNTANGTIDSFQREYMLRIVSAEDRLISDEEIRWYSRTPLLRNKQKYNFYITTDFAVSQKETADYTVLMVWAYDSDNKWYLVDGSIGKQPMNETIDRIYALVSEYKPDSVGIEVTGQQRGFLDILREDQVRRNIFFRFATDLVSKTEGIRPVSDKLTRIKMTAPLFKTARLFLPKELESTMLVQELITEIKLTTQSGIRAKHDDCIDALSMITYMNPVRPTSYYSDDEDHFVIDFDGQRVLESTSAIDSYIV